MQLHTAQPANELIGLDYAIRHDIELIDDLDEFLNQNETEDCMFAMLGNAGCFY